MAFGRIQKTISSIGESRVWWPRLYLLCLKGKLDNEITVSPVIQIILFDFFLIKFTKKMRRDKLIYEK